MENFKKHPICQVIAIFVAMLMTLATTAPVAHAASHSEAPLIALDPAADMTDIYAFRSWQESEQGGVYHECHPATGACRTVRISSTSMTKWFTPFSIDINQDGKCRRHYYTSSRFRH